jgi:hypothetical protein
MLGCEGALDQDHNHPGWRHAMSTGRLRPLRRQTTAAKWSPVRVPSRVVIEQRGGPNSAWLLPAREVVCIKENYVHLQDVYHQWNVEVVGSDVPTTRTAKQLTLQLKERARIWKWGQISPVGGLTLLITAAVGLYMARRRQIVTLLRRNGAGPRTPTTPNMLLAGPPKGRDHIGSALAVDGSGDLLSREQTEQAVQADSVPALIGRKRYHER